MRIKQGYLALLARLLRSGRRSSMSLCTLAVSYERHGARKPLSRRGSKIPSAKLLSIRERFPSYTKHPRITRGTKFVRQTLLRRLTPLRLVWQMATFSIGDADDEDDFAQLRGTKTAAPSAKDGKITKLGAVPLKAPESAKGELAVPKPRACRERTRLCA